MTSRPGVSDPENSLVPFGRFERLHFARFVVLDDRTVDDITPAWGDGVPLPPVGGLVQRPPRSHRRRARAEQPHPRGPGANDDDGRRGARVAAPPVGDPADAERGFCFIARNADIRRQFEFVSSPWMMMGTKVDGLGEESDRLLGGRNPIPGCPVTNTLSLPQPGGVRWRSPGSRSSSRSGAGRTSFCRGFARCATSRASMADPRIARAFRLRSARGAGWRSSTAGAASAPRRAGDAPGSDSRVS
jgi:hypothetical protein